MPPAVPDVSYADRQEDVAAAIVTSFGSISFAASGNNRRKRAREAMAPPPAVKEDYVNLFALQQQQQQSMPFANMALFQNQNRVSSSPSPAATALVSTGLRLAFDEQQQHLLQQQEGKQTNALRYSSPPSLFASVSDELAAQAKQHEEEVDRFVREQVSWAPATCLFPSPSPFLGPQS